MGVNNRLETIFKRITGTLDQKDAEKYAKHLKQISFTTEITHN